MRAQPPLFYGTPESDYLGLPLPSLSLHVDAQTWPLALAVATLGLAVLLTDVSRATETSWDVWAGDLGLTAMGIAAVLAGNFVTMLMVWTLVDVVEIGILFRQIRQEERRRRILIFFFTNLLGSMAVVASFIAAGEIGSVVQLDTIPDQVEVYLILAVGLRMGVFPLQVTFLSDQHEQRGQGTLLRLIPPAATLSLLVHVSASRVPAGWYGILLVFAVLAGVYGSIGWARVVNALRGRLLWIIATAGMAFTAAVQSQQAAALAWGLAMLYPGALLFLASVRTRRMLPIGLLSVLALSSLPFTPTYAGLSIYQDLHPLVLLLPIAQVVLVAGFIRHMMRETEPLTGVEPWVKVVYVIGLSMLPLNHFLSFFLGSPIAAEGNVPIWPLLVMVGAAGLGALAYWRKVRIPGIIFIQLDKFFSLRWIDRLLDWLGKALEQLVAGITLLLEGDGGMLWALVFLAMLISILGQISGGGGL